MECPDCHEEMRFVEAVAEGAGDVLMPYSYYWCSCGYEIHDYEDEFEWPEDESDSNP
jgi:hypothetical protein